MPDDDLIRAYVNRVRERFDILTEYNPPMGLEDDRIRELLSYNAPEAYYQRRAAVINEARRRDWTWEEIAEVLGMSPVGVQRAPGVASPWNEAKKQQEEQS